MDLAGKCCRFGRGNAEELARECCRSGLLSVVDLVGEMF